MTTISVDSYSRQQKILHWSIVVLIAAQYLLFDSIGHLFRDVMKEGTYVYDFISTGHLVVGLAILLLMGWRFWLRKQQGVPAAPANDSTLMTQAAHLTHIVFYALLVLLPVFGLLAWFLKIGFFAELHEMGTNVLLALIVLHVGGALYHQFWLRDNLISRMK